MKNFILALIALSILYRCIGDKTGCDVYASDYSCSFVENKATYNVLFYFPEDKTERFIGQSKGLSQCYQLARNYAFEKGNGRSDYGWSYICCMQTEDSNCKEKHR
jgi:hypothetical protein